MTPAPPKATITGGYILLARKLLESEIMDKPPHFLKLWILKKDQRRKTASW
jgi:hypothetical protein